MLNVTLEQAAPGSLESHDVRNEVQLAPFATDLHFPAPCPESGPPDLRSSPQQERPPSS